MSGRAGPAPRRGVRALAAGQRAAVALALAFSSAAPALPDDRKLLQAATGAKMDVLAVPASASSMAAPAAALQGIPLFKPTASFFAAPALPAFVSTSGDDAVIGAVVPSHLYPRTSVATSWSIWNGFLKAYKLDERGNIPTAPAAARPMPVRSPLPRSSPDETSASDADESLRRPVWNAGRVLGYTDPVASLIGGQAPTAAATGDSSAISVWPGRRMVWGDGTGPALPLLRRDFSTPAGSCSAACFDDLMAAMGLDPLVPSDVARATRTVQFLRGGKTPGTGSRDEILTDLGTYGTVMPGGNSPYSYHYQDDPPPGRAPSKPPASGENKDRGYAHKLGDIFHSEAAVLLPPKHFQFISGNVTPRSGACGALADCSYNTFRNFHRFRRKVVFVGSNDGFLHAFDAGVFDRDDDPGKIGSTAEHPFNDAFDLGTGREIFAYAPKAVMKLKQSPPSGFPSLLSFPPQPQYFVDGSPALADVFIDTAHGGTPDPAARSWKTILVSGLRQGGQHYFALDVTQPDRYDSNGAKSDARDNSPDCLDGGPGCAAPYPTILWELTDDCSVDATTCVPNTSPMGETWSRPVLGRIKVGNGAGSEDRYVAIFGGGFDSSFVPGREAAASDVTTRGRAIYIVNVETGRILYKATRGTDDRGNGVQFAPIPAPPAVADVDDDGYLDVAYIGDLNGRMWRLDLSAGVCEGCGTSLEKLNGYRPFLLYDALKGGSQTQPIQPIFLDAGIIFLAGGARPTLGVAFGTGYRAELLRENESVNRFQFVIDPGAGRVTFHDTNLVNLTPFCPGTPCATSPSTTGPLPAVACANNTMTNCGYFLDFSTANEKAISTVFSTAGKLGLVTFRPDQDNFANGAGLGGGGTFRYSVNVLENGQGGYAAMAPRPGRAGVVTDYRQSLGPGFGAAAQSQAPGGVIIDSVLFSGGAINQQNTTTLKALSESWKEQ